KLRSELLERALSGTSDADLCEWLSVNRIVFPGCESEVSSKLREFVSKVVPAALMAEAEPATRSALPVKPTTKKAGKIGPFPQPERNHDDVPVRQLALF